MDQTSNLKSLGFIRHGFYNRHECDLVENPVVMNQVYSADVFEVTEPVKAPPSVDALVTKKPGFNLTVRTADCVPLLMADPENKIIAAIHASWHAGVQGVLEKTVLKMLSIGARIETIRVGIGPHLQKESFDVMEDVRRIFPITEKHFFQDKPGYTGKFLFDYHSYLEHRLRQMGICNIESVVKNTYTDTDYNSFRRDKVIRHQYSSIMLLE
ncbi:MAG: polyphenol oxidase family protein [Lactobacillales bacterium]|jgi:YfiH family protein|nr:polyphenol oxidase family protein [Lactobacillales bacterium]